jgi:hypothetical protein
MARRSLGIACALVALGISERAQAHGPLPSKAPILEPSEPCAVFDQSVMIHWQDCDCHIRTGTASIELHYVKDNTPTFIQGDRPPLLIQTSTTIMSGRKEYDLDNTFVWDTSHVPSGTYWIWSYVVDPPTEFGTISEIMFTKYPIIINHPPDAISPAVSITDPDSPIKFADDHFTVKYTACDPDPSAKVKLEYTLSHDGTDLHLLADDLPPYRCGDVDWIPLCIRPEGCLTFKASISDSRGMSFSSWGVYFLLITHLAPPDAGCPFGEDGPPTPTAYEDKDCAVAGAPDAAISDTEADNDGSTGRDAAGDLELSSKKGCKCSGADGDRARPSVMLLALALAHLCRSRRWRSGAPSR